MGERKWPQHVCFQVCLACAVHPVVIPIVLDCVCGAISLSQVGVAFDVLALSCVGIIIFVCRFPSSLLSSTCSSSDPDIHFHQLIHESYFFLDSNVWRKLSRVYTLRLLIFFDGWLHCFSVTVRHLLMYVCRTFGSLTSTPPKQR